MAKKFEKGVNDLETWCKINNRLDLLQEWDPTNKISPNQISFGSHKSVNWICKKGHIYAKDIHSRCQGTGCSTCSGIKFTHKGKLFEEYPFLIHELDLNKNDYASVKNLTCGSSKEIIWICKHGHSYPMSAARKIFSKGCPFCSNKRLLIGVNDLETWCIENGRTFIIDDWDYSKNTIQPKEIMFGSNKKVYFKCHICGHEWKTPLNSRTKQHTDCKKCTRRVSSSFPEQCIYYYFSSFFSDAVNGDTSILNGRELDIWIPSINFAIEYDGKKWHNDPTKDMHKDNLCKELGIVLYRIREKGIEPLDSDNSITFEYNYGDWISLGNIIQIILSDAGIKSSEINIPRDEYIIKERYYKHSLANSFAALYPDIAREWHPSKNRSITPDIITPETHDQYYWLCPNGHTYKASPKNRVRMNSNCPYCSNKKILKGYNDLETTHPHIAIDYDNQKNLRKSYEVSRGCSDRVWFKCHKCGYEFNYHLNEYIKIGGLCPACSQKSKNKFQKVLKYETNEIFDTLRSAARSISDDEERINQIYKNISSACKKKVATAYGYHWFYVTVDKDENIIDDLSSLPIKNVDKHIIGQTMIMKNGQKATVIRDNGSTDIDIQFEDGTVINTRRQSFRNGTVRNPNAKKTPHRNTSIERTTEKKAHRNTSIERTTKKKSILGKTNIMKSGESAKCIEDFGWNNITVQFEDKTVLKQKSRRSFLAGTIANPNSIFNYIGKEKRMNCGISCKIISIVSKNDIDVQFEDGDIVKHTSLSKFNKGIIVTNAMSHNYKYITGQCKLMKCGHYATVIADRGAHDIDVQFDNGVISYNKDRANFNRGDIGLPRTSSILGMTKIMNNGLSATVIADNGWDNIDIQFENGLVVQHRRREHFKKGSIELPGLTTRKL